MYKFVSYVRMRSAISIRKKVIIYELDLMIETIEKNVYKQLISAR